MTAPADPAALPAEAAVPERLTVVPLAQLVVFPHIVVPVAVTSLRTVGAIDQIVGTHKRLLLGVVKVPEGGDLPPGVFDEASPDALYGAGTLAAVVRLLKLGDGTLRMLVQGLERVRLLDVR